MPQQSPKSAPALGEKPYRPHPAAPTESPAPSAELPGADAATGPGAGSPAGDPLVPLSTRIPKSLRRRLRVAAFEGDTDQQGLVIQALDAHLPGGGRS